MNHVSSQFIPLNVVILTVSDTRTTETDTSGQYLFDQLISAGHTVIERLILKDNPYQIRAQVANWVASDNIQVVLITGGTGFTDRDSTPEAVSCLFDKHVEGFGELFRQLSYSEISTSTIQSRTLAGLSNHTLICCMPGSTSACRTAWQGILLEQLDATHKPCNFVAHLGKKIACTGRG